MYDALRRLHHALARLSFALALLAPSGCESCGGCDAAEQPITVEAGPAVNPWTVRSDEALTIALGAAQAEATRLERRVLLVFVGFGDLDSEAVVRALSEGPSQAVIGARYVRVYVNVGHEGVAHAQLRHAHDVRQLATLVVLEASGRRVARATFSPVSDLEPLSSATLARWLSSPRGR